MSRFKVGDIVEYWVRGKYAYRVKVIAEPSFNVKVLDYPERTYHVGGKHKVDLEDDNYRLATPPLTKEEKFAISKKRVENRHLRKKVKA